MHTEWTDRLSDYIDGELDAHEKARIEAHLAQCDECSGVLEDLRTVVLRAQSLGATAPDRDLWPGVHAAIQPAPGPADVIDLATRRAAPRRPLRSRTVRLSVPQLAAASLALIFASGGTAMLLRSDRVAPEAVATATEREMPTVAVADAADRAAVESQSTELAELEELLLRHRESLSPNTVRILEKNLAAIDRAITESLQALEIDPGNEFLTGHLERARERKLEYLREASAAFQWST